MFSFQSQAAPSTSFKPSLSSSSGDGSEKIVLILVGLIGSGKSTFAQALQEHFPTFRRCNQDDLGNRRVVEQLARDSLRQGLSVCVDRTNFNEAQRKYWIQIAQEFPGTLIWVIVFDTPYEVCVSRLRERKFDSCHLYVTISNTDSLHTPFSTGKSHPTIKTPEQALDILARFASDFVPPMSHEGYHRCLYFSPSDHPSPTYSESDISTILQKVRDSVPAIPSVSAPSRTIISKAPRGSRPFPAFSNRNSRGRGGYRRYNYHQAHFGGGGGRSQYGSLNGDYVDAETVTQDREVISDLHSQSTATEPAGPMT
ncbi:P-loop containing nucleoside triphosphate hydrolase protein [Armillaria gallica]|uniref:P-loop containing nucleoside triphosphate hydrolase protein n=1 Tax=Armillaria gallica TaxID=47427 RepID=A0A2H3E896_ARMGA|nr:P-loop containing nucleoside triphosphate hydrolase protein [Armillaria gallica]